MLIDDLIELAPHEESVYWDVRKRFDKYEGPLDVVVDIGSHFGSFALLAARAGAKKVIAIEPHPENFSRLVSNIALNRRNECITPISMAVWRDSGKRMKLYGLGPSIKNSLAYKVNCPLYVHVETVSFNDVMKSLGDVDILKMSIEGTEVDIFSDPKSAEVLKNVGYLDVRFSHIDSTNEFDGRIDRMYVSLDNIDHAFHNGGFADVKITGDSQRIIAYRNITKSSHSNSTPRKPHRRKPS